MNTQQETSVKRIEQVQSHFSIEDRPSIRVMALLADLRHYCDAKGLDFGDLDAKAHGVYLEELA